MFSSRFVPVITLVFLFSLGASAVLAFSTTTPVFEVTGANTDTTGAVWNTYGYIQYTSPVSMGVVNWSWPGSTAVSQAMYGFPSYDDAPVYHREVLIYDPTGSPTTIWESCPQNSMLLWQIPGTGFRYFVDSDPSPNTWQGSTMCDVRLKAQCAGAQTSSPPNDSMNLSKNQTQ